MKKITNNVLSILFLVVLVSSCKSEKTLQRYLVDSQEKTGFITVDIPTTFLQLKSEDVSSEVKETLKSIKKVNVVYLPIKGNEDRYVAEKMELKNVFSNDDYKSLMTMKAQGMHVNVYYTGDTESIDEVIAFGYGKQAGVGVARLLGDNMNPAKIIAMMNSVTINEDNISIDQFNDIFKSL
jgi:hypothetical protein